MYLINYFNDELSKLASIIISSTLGLTPVMQPGISILASHHIAK